MCCLEPCLWIPLHLWHHKGQKVQHYTLSGKWKRDRTKWDPHSDCRPLTAAVVTHHLWAQILLPDLCQTCLTEWQIGHCFQVTHSLHFGICRVKHTTKEAPHSKAVASRRPPRPHATHSRAEPWGPPPLSHPRRLFLPCAQRPDQLAHDFSQPHQALRSLPLICWKNTHTQNLFGVRNGTTISWM